MSARTMHYLLQQQPTSLDRRMAHATLADDSQHEYDDHNWPAESRLSIVMEAAESEAPTPTAARFHVKDRAYHHDQFDDLYDMTDNEAEDIPISISMSPVAQTARPMRNNHLSLVIPSPSLWPTIQQAKKNGVPSIPVLSPGMLSPASILSPTAESLARIAAQNAQRLPTYATPSLDGSLTSEELSNHSCPSTPDVAHAEDDGSNWNAPVQLHRQALETLDCLTAAVYRPPERQATAAEMQQVYADGGEGSGDYMDLLVTPVTVPSPGGFFSTLEPATRNTWAIAPSPCEQPSTTIAENFYTLPWSAANQPEPRIVETTFVVPHEDTMTDGPPTARYVPLPTPQSAFRVQTPGLYKRDLEPIQDFEDPAEYKEDYAQELQENSKVNFDRTSHWLSAQNYYPPDEAAESPVVSTHERSFSGTEAVPTTKTEKSVRFSEAGRKEPVYESQPETPEEKDDTFVQGFQYLHEKSHHSDAFVQRTLRSDALRVDRECLPVAHIKQVEGQFDLHRQEEATSKRASHWMNEDEEKETSEERENIATAQRERQALKQIQTSSWNLEATKYLNGGNLLMSPSGRQFAQYPKGRVLDLGGQATADWAWQVALEHPKATVHTVYTTDQQKVDKSISGPANHKLTAVPNLWTLPFPNNHFDLVSARNLFAQLHSSEYDVCLRECMRVLKPGGYLEFALLDADILSPGRLAQSISVEFGFNLKTRGYDPAPTKSWLPRLRRAGFAEVRRAWLVLPMARHAFEHDAAEAYADEGNTRDASYISGMVGSWAWERWMVKVQREMGKSEDKLLDGVAAALEEGARSGASWRYLSGYARKPLR